MIIKKGMIVKALARKERGRYFVAVEQEGKTVLIADGRKRRLGSPKRKNIRHLELTGREIELNDITEKKLRNVLREVSSTL